MNISKDFAKSQMARMGQLDGFPHSQAAATELVAALQCADTETMCESIVSEVIRSETKCPKPAQIMEILRDRMKHIPRKTRGCHRCEHTGWRPYWLLVTIERSGRRTEERIARYVVDEIRSKLPPNQQIYEFREHCDCAPHPMGENGDRPDPNRNCVCRGWGTVGERPNVRCCTCDHAEWLKREIPNWLELANEMPGTGLERGAPITALMDTLASGTRAHD